jgi:hypothetical protein
MIRRRRNQAVNPSARRLFSDGRTPGNVWSIGLIIAASALLAVLIEPLVPHPSAAARNDAMHRNVTTLHVERSISTPADRTGRSPSVIASSR